MRIALGIEYDGATFSGWQRQSHVASIQQSLENALSKIADTKIEVQCAGRTDAGVHATGQIVHFDTDAQRPERAWTMGVNTHLPDTIAVAWSTEVPEDFHARYSATARRYRYIIYNSRLRPGIHTHGLTHEYRPLDADKMHQAAQCLVGENDFSAFRAAHCQSKTPYRNLTSISVSRQGNYVILDVEANAFLHHMVRNITGSLLEIGCGEQNVEWMQYLLSSKDRTQAGATAKPHGLYLVHVTYPHSFGLPTKAMGPIFLPD
ncbi:tRNA pseudouridine(38-40) synthase TruA [Alteromonas facilis]|uniref:tRNA pseudouridine(38-40) synthase TruA n=1 Tax=Alteromonas facilis TaxID=2048004 RepID=UPI000C287B93|nr:tRNA pseudouridine(38-40) synthase TruA [Alteromonas facilis]